VDAADAEAPTAGLASDGSVPRLAGTPGYLSPEALRGDRPDAHFDLWALTVTLYQSITGTLPREAWNLGTLVGKVLTDSEAQKLAERCPPAVCGFFETALARNKRHRHSDAGSMRAELDSCLRLLTAP